MENETIKALIKIGTPKALQKAFLQIENEAGCNPVTAHPLYKSWKAKATGYPAESDLESPATA